jgi:hypothetical protein
MIVPVKDSLKLIKTLVSDVEMQLKIWEDIPGNMYVSSTCSMPQGTVYYDTNASLLCMFIENRINLQTLFNLGSTFFVEIEAGGKSSLYSVRDIEIELKQGHKTLKQLRGFSPFEVW